MRLEYEDLFPPMREFPDRAMRRFFKRSRNLRGLFKIVAPEFLRPIAFSQLNVLPRSYVRDDFRERESDLVFEAPYRPLAGKPVEELMIYLLLEHQSANDPFIAYRILQYMVEIWMEEERVWNEQKVKRSERWFRPILPVLAYTGARAWKGRIDMAQRILQSPELNRFVPRHDIVFLNLPDCSLEQLVSGDNPVGWLLRIIQQQEAQSDRFAAEVELACEHLQPLARKEQSYWKQLMYFLYAISYYRRDPSERPVLMDILDKTAANTARRKELTNMGKTIAQTLMEEGREEGRLAGREEGFINGKQDALLNVLRLRLRRVPKTIERRIRKIDSEKKLDDLLAQALRADSIKDIDV